MNVKQTLAWIREHSSDRAALTELLVEELNDKKRKTVLDALDSALEAFEVTAEPVRAREEDGTFAADNPDTEANEAFVVPPATPEATPIPVAPAEPRGSIRWVWYDKGYQRRLGVTFLNSEDQALFGPNIDMPRHDAIAQRWPCPEPSGSAIVKIPGAPAVPFKPTPAPSQSASAPGTSPKAGNPTLVGPRGNQPGRILSDDHPDMIRRKKKTGPHVGPRGE